MQNQFYNQPAVDWAKQNLAQPVEIELRFASRWMQTLIYALLFSLPLLIVGSLIFLKLTGGSEVKWWGIFLCGGVMLIPPSVIVLLGALTRQKLVKSLDASGVKSSMGRAFLWDNLYYIDHVSKTSRAGNVSRKTEDNQLELVFADGKAIIPPLINNREQVWGLINSMPVEVKDDGVVRTNQSAAGNLNFDEIAKMMGEMKAEYERNK